MEGKPKGIIFEHCDICFKPWGQGHIMIMPRSCGDDYILGSMTHYLGHTTYYLMITRIICDQQMILRSPDDVLITTTPGVPTSSMIQLMMITRWCGDRNLFSSNHQFIQSSQLALVWSPDDLIITRSFGANYIPGWAQDHLVIRTKLVV